MKKVAGILFVLLILLGLQSAALAYDNIMPLDAYNMAVSDPNVYILDVRTAEEWIWVGHPGMNKLGEGIGLQGKVFNVAYDKYHADVLTVNPTFIKDVNEIFGSNPDVVLITMCRSGVRSQSAAALLEAAGYRAINMLTGFQGGTDSRGYRTKNGWVINQLPYTFSGAGAYQD